MSLTPDNRWQTPFCVNIFMLIVTTNAELSNRLISSALPNGLPGRPKQTVSDSDTGSFAAPKRLFHVMVWYMR